jgi:hypothetical protein
MSGRTHSQPDDRIGSGEQLHHAVDLPGFEDCRDILCCARPYGRRNASQAREKQKLLADVVGE